MPLNFITLSTGCGITTCKSSSFSRRIFWLSLPVLGCVAINTVHLRIKIRSGCYKITFVKHRINIFCHDKKASFFHSLFIDNLPVIAGLYVHLVFILPKTYSLYFLVLFHRSSLVGWLVAWS